MPVAGNPGRRRTGLTAGHRGITTQASVTYIANGIAAFLFSCTGPVAIILSVAAVTGLDDAHVASWLFGGFTIAGAVSLWFTLRYRQPLVFAWTIPGTILLLTSLDQLTFAEAVGAYLATGILILAVGLAGLSGRMMALVPKPIVMGMVAGIFLDFGLGLVGAFGDSPLLAGVMVAVFVAATAIPRLGRAAPPILLALLAGTAVVLVTGTLRDTGPLPGLITRPQVFLPAFSLQAMFELVVPLAVTVLAIQNAQGFAVLSHAGHKPPMDAMTTACGLGSLVLAMIGAVSMCVTGPSNAILSSSGDPPRQYIGGITYCVLAIIFGTFGTFMTWLALKLPVAFIATLGGLAVMRVLEGAFVAAFADRHTTGALVALLVTVSGITLFNIGAPFWGLVFGVTVSWLLKEGRAA